MGVVSMHVPKTGGTSIRKAIEKSSIGAECSFVYGDDPVDADSPSRLGLSSARAEAERIMEGAPTVVHGHFPAAKFLDVTGAEQYDFSPRSASPSRGSSRSMNTGVT